MAIPALRRAASAGAALLLALCAGAAWAVVALIMGDGAAWMSVPAALVTYHGLSYLKPASRVARAGSVLALYACTVAYAHYLLSASIVSSQLGLHFRDVLWNVGPEMAIALATSRGRMLDAMTIGVVGVALAVFAARRA